MMVVSFDFDTIGTTLYLQIVEPKCIITLIKANVN